MTHTYAILEVSPATYSEIREILLAAGYGHVFSDVPNHGIIDMTGLGIRAKSEVAATDSEYQDLLNDAKGG